MLLKLERASYALMVKGQTPLQFAGSDLGNVRNPFAVELVQLGFVFEGIHLADAAAHEEHDAILGLARKRGRFTGERIDDDGSGPSLACQEASEC